MSSELIPAEETRIKIRRQPIGVTLLTLWSTISTGLVAFQLGSAFGSGGASFPGVVVFLGLIWLSFGLWRLKYFAWRALRASPIGSILLAVYFYLKHVFPVVPDLLVGLIICFVIGLMLRSYIGRPGLRSVFAVPEEDMDSPLRDVVDVLIGSWLPIVALLLPFRACALLFLPASPGSGRFPLP